MQRAAWLLAALPLVMLVGEVQLRAEPSLLTRCEAYAIAHQALPLHAERGEVSEPELRDLLAEVAAGDVHAVLASTNPQVRTLGALAIATADDSSRLSLLSPLVDDDRPSFACTSPAHVALLPQPDGTLKPSGPPTFTQPCSVARWATMMLESWTQVSHQDGVAWKTWWSNVPDADRLVSVWRHRIARAARDGSGVEAVASRLRAKHGDLLFAVTAITYDAGGPAPWTSDQLDLLARGQFTTQLAMRCLKRTPPFVDPWVRPGNHAYAQLCSRLLAALAYSPAEGAEILALEGQERGREPTLANADWPIAASRAFAQPEAKRAVLIEAYGRYPEPLRQYDRWRIGCELWRAVGSSALDTLLAWFFAEMEPHINTGGFQSAVLECVGQGSPEGRRFVAALLADGRSSDLTWAVHDALARACNALAGEDIVPRQQLERLHHPLGMYHLSRARGLQEGRQKHPEATRLVEEALAAWRARLRSHVSERGW